MRESFIVTDGMTVSVSEELHRGGYSSYILPSHLPVALHIEESHCTNLDIQATRPERCKRSVGSVSGRAFPQRSFI
jgi:hypothetical protein